MTAIHTATVVLAKAAAYDPRFREPDPIILAAWAEALSDVDPDEALDGVAWHYAHETRTILPADVLRYAEPEKTLPYEKALPDLPPLLPPDEAAAWRKRIAKELGHDPDADEHRRRVTRVECVWCGAKQGDPCVNPSTGEPLRGSPFHALRERAANGEQVTGRSDSKP